MRLWLLNVLGGLLLALLPLGGRGQDDGVPPLTVSNFRIREVDPDSGEVRWAISGEEAVTRQGQLFLRRVQMLVNRADGDELRVFSPDCRYDRLKQIGRSDERVHVRTDNMTIDGTGFQIDLVDQRITVLDRVRVRIYQADQKMLGNMDESR